MAAICLPVAGVLLGDFLVGVLFSGDFVAFFGVWKAG
jgi:hypothetical protein